MSTWLGAAAFSCIVAPGVAFALIALMAWARGHKGLPERAIVTTVALATGLSALAALAAIVVMARAGISARQVDLGDWFHVSHYGFSLRLAVDWLSLPLAALGAVLSGVVAAFSSRYLHRERGFGRFYMLLSLLSAGVELVVLAGTLDLVFFGWELVGLSSALLIAFFDDRAAPVRHGLRAYVTYRVCDVGLLAAAVWLHHTAGSAAFVSSSERASDLLGAGVPVPASTLDATIVGLLLCWAAMGKSAQVPLGDWLPRAMEGPTPSSAIFYGALSIHLGPFLLLRAMPVLQQAPVAAAAIVTVGALSALHGTFVGRVQTDIKSALAYASMTQVGLIFVEIGLGLSTLAVVHMLGHACVRTLQLLRAPSLLHDHHHLEQAMGRHLPRTGGHLERLVPARLQPLLYRLALERGYYDTLLRDHLVGSMVRFLRAVDRREKHWADALERGTIATVERSEAMR